MLMFLKLTALVAIFLSFGFHPLVEAATVVTPSSPTKINLIPHKARYNITLNRSTEPVMEGGLSQLTGYATIEIQEVPGGYIRNVTFVMYAYPSDQPMQTIIRSFATFESSNGQDFTFRISTRNELSEEVTVKGEGLSPQNLLGVVKCDMGPAVDASQEDYDYTPEDELNIEPINSRIDLPAGTIFPAQFLLRMMRMVSSNVQENTSISLYDPYWSNVYDVDLAVVPSNISTQFNLVEGVVEQAKKQLEGQPVKSVVCGFYAMGIKEGSKDAADEPLHQMKVSLLPCGIITEWVMEDPAVGEEIKLTLSRVDLFG